MEPALASAASSAYETSCTSTSWTFVPFTLRPWARWRGASSADRAAALFQLHRLFDHGRCYATPYLEIFRDEAVRVLAFMPASRAS